MAHVSLEEGIPTAKPRCPLGSVVTWGADYCGGNSQKANSGQEYGFLCGQSDNVDP